MRTLVIGIRRFLREEEGANGIEYSILAALIAIAFTVGATTLGTNLNTFLAGIGTYIGTFTPVS
ncbi:MAG: Flp family type IVb pilin [Betaproteobacteria bacterium]|nr:Flp family type IVb pilin [Betaproteobacteria bacterium]